MKATDIFHRWVSWSEGDQCYVGYCPDLFLGGVHGDDPIEVARELQSVIDEWEEIFEKDHRDLPEAKTRPMRELV
jgi:predicted RNase H-like HicB family nuclease